MMLPPQGSGDNGGDDSGLLDAEQVGRLLGVKGSWVLSRARAGKIPHSRLGKYVRFDRAAVMRWVEEDCSHGPRGAG